MFQRILVVLDPAKDFGPALGYTIELVKCWRPSVVGLYTAFEEAMPFKAAASEGVEPKKFVGKQTVKDFKEELREEAGSDIQFTRVVEEGPYEVVIPTVAAQEGADLLVLGSFHAKVKRALVGSDIERVIEYSPCSVLLVRDPSHLPRAGSTMVFAHDSARIPSKAIETLARLSEELGASIHPVLGFPPKGYEKGKRTATRLMAKLSRAGAKTKEPQVLTSRWILGPHAVVHRAVAGLMPMMTILSRFRGVSSGNATHWLVHEFVADTPCPILFMK